MNKIINFIIVFIMFCMTAGSVHADSSSGYPYFYYLPYFTQGADNWTGVGLRNTNLSQNANVSVVVYEQNGNAGEPENKVLPPRGQDAFVVGSGLSGEGWIRVNSDQPLTGLCFFGAIGENSRMADITLISDLAERLHVPHVGQNFQWDTAIMICNPNDVSTTVTLTFMDKDGNTLTSQSYTIPANGSGKYAVAGLVGGAEYVNGSVEISASHGVAAFALYNDLKSGGSSYAGISAVNPDSEAAASSTGLCSDCPRYFYYLPYFTEGGGQWTGVGLRNSDSDESAIVSVNVYDQRGDVGETESRTLPPGGQDAFVVGAESGGEGWILVKSNRRLSGLCFFGKTGEESRMADITLIRDLSETLYVPHVGQNFQWDTTIMLCSPNDSSTTVTLTFADKDGNALSPRNYTIPANGSGAYEVADLVQGDEYVNGSVEISASHGVAAFALYTDLKNGGRSFAGISAVTTDTSDSPLVLPVKTFEESKANLAFQSETEIVRFLKAEPGYAIAQPIPLSASASAEDAARSFLSVHDSIFGLTDQTTELGIMKTKTASRQRAFARFRQRYNGIPIIGGELVVQTDAAKNIMSVNGEILLVSDKKRNAVNTRPTVSSEMARQTALTKAAEVHERNTDELTATAPELWIYNPLILGFSEPDETMLVWRTEVTSIQLAPINEFIIVDAHSGNVVLNFNQVDTAMFRMTYDSRTGTLCRSEDEGPSGDPDCDNAHDYAGDTYNFYKNTHGRNGIDNADMEMISYVHGGDFCNASWDKKCKCMIYGDGCQIIVDDVVAHEITHGVTDYESGLLYVNQSGAINESFSDIWGEFVDQTNGKGTDTPEVRWEIGEDITDREVMRDMKDPTIHDQPDRMTSELYNCNECDIDDSICHYFNDNGGVHTNSGIGNKTAYLMTDGGTFNGYTVRDLGYEKVADLFYEVQTNILTSAASYPDLYDALILSCSNLGYSADDCQQVQNAVNAVEMYLEPCQASPTTTTTTTTSTTSTTTTSIVPTTTSTTTTSIVPTTTSTTSTTTSVSTTSTSTTTTIVIDPPTVKYLSPDQTLTVGQSYTLRGTVSADDGDRLTKVTAAVNGPGFDGGNNFAMTSGSISESSFDLNSFTFRTSTFGEAGTYTIGIWAITREYPASEAIERFSITVEEPAPSYSVDTTSTIDGDSIWGPILRLQASISGTDLTLTVTKRDDSAWTSSGYMYFKVGSYESYGHNRETAYMYEGRSSASYTHDLSVSDYSGHYPKEFYARYESDAGDAWVGPITVTED